MYVVEVQLRRSHFRVFDDGTAAQQFIARVRSRLGRRPVIVIWDLMQP